METASKYSEEQKHAIIESQMKGLQDGTILPEFSFKQVVNERDGFEKFKKYFDRFVAGEVTKEELIEFEGDWLAALREKDRKKKQDFIDKEGLQLQRNEIAVINNRPLTDLGNSERILDQFAQLLRFCPPMKVWYIWNYDEGRWKIDEDGYIIRIAKDVVRRIFFEASRSPFQEYQKKLASWAIQSEALTHIKDAITFAQSDKKVIIMPDDFDKNDFSFNVANGTLDLKSLELQIPKKAENISKLSDFYYTPGAKCPMFLAYLDRIFRSNPHKEEIIKFLQRAVGYTLTGSTQEQCLFLLYGSGANGKSVFLDILLELMGEYGTTTQSKTFTTDRGQISNDVAALSGKRLVCASENSVDSKLDESLVKQLTGGEVISARFLHKEFFTFRPKFKLWWAFNHPPAISDMTLSIWRRIKIIPFTEVLPESEWDKNLAMKIKENELAGVFNWAIEGLKSYNEFGLQQPGIITEATLSYKNEQDILLDFFESNYELTKNETDLIKAADLYASFKTWWLDVEPSKPMSSTKFGRLCRDRGMIKTRKSEGVYYVGIRSIFSPIWGKDRPLIERRPIP